MRGDCIAANPHKGLPLTAPANQGAYLGQVAGMCARGAHAPQRGQLAFHSRQQRVQDVLRSACAAEAVIKILRAHARASQGGDHHPEFFGGTARAAWPHSRQQRVRIALRSALTAEVSEHRPAHMCTCIKS